MIQDPIVILANGIYPTHSIPLKILQEAESIICCDGAVNKLVENGHSPHIIIGDLDSVDEKYKIKYQKKLYHIPDQDENDLRKAIKWLEKQNIQNATILGATGNREDHTIANVFSLIQFPTIVKFKMITDFGIFNIIEDNDKLTSFLGEQVSIFSIDSTIKITSKDLKYNLINYRLRDLYSCTLNESLSDDITISISHGRIMVYQAFLENSN